MLTEIDRILKKFETSKDIQIFINILHDLMEVFFEGYIFFNFFHFKCFFVCYCLELSNEKNPEITERAIECDALKIIVMKCEESKNFMLYDMCGTLLSYIAGGLNLVEEKNLEGKKKDYYKECFKYLNSLIFLMFFF